jgi:acyl-CoA ligase (AMP-forming) (exosortase A-associated)
MSYLLHHLVVDAARRAPAAEALVHGARRLDYAALDTAVAAAAAALLQTGLARQERVAVYLEKTLENVVAMFGASAAGGTFVPVNPLLKPEQVAYIMADCQVGVLVTSADRLMLLADVLPACEGLRLVVVTGPAGTSAALPTLPMLPSGVAVHRWDEWMAAVATALPLSLPLHLSAHRCIDTDMAAILYTSGSTGKPKGVVLSHRNMLAGAHSVVSYLDNTPADRILAVLPLSFDYGLSQLTTAFHAGATVVLINHLLPRDILKAVQAESITGLAAVPPLWLQLMHLPWPADCTLRYLTNSGGAMPRSTLDALQNVLPRARPFLMYGLTEAFRSTYLPPEELGRRPDSMGKAIPNAEILVLRPDGSECAAGEPGELVHRGALVSLGYWNDADKTAQRFRPLLRSRANGGLPLPEIAVWSGDTVRKDEEGFLYFIGRSDEMIKTSGYRVSPAEVEEVVYARARVAEAAAVGVSHPALGQAIVLVVCARDGETLVAADVLADCKPHLPGYMMPARVIVWSTGLPRNPNGKIDRKMLGLQYAAEFAEAAQPSEPAAVPVAGAAA